MARELSEEQKAKLEKIAKAPLVMGVDEVGLGAIAGPVTVCAVICKNPWVAHEWVKDSKKVTPARRSWLVNNYLFPPTVIASYIDSLPAGYITAGALRIRLMKLMNYVINAGLEINPNCLVVVDGQYAPSLTPQQLHDGARLITLEKADDLISQVSAASIMAKVDRDSFMIESSLKHPEYGWERNMGYGTKFHLEAIAKHGITSLHRKDFAPIARLRSRS